MKRVNLILLFVFSIVISMIIISCSDNETEPDTEAPTIEITNPLDNAELASESIIVITADANDNEGIDFVEFYIDSVLVSSDNISPYQYEWDTTNILGDHTIFAKAYDNANNSATSDVVTVTIIEMLKLFISPSESLVSVDEEITLSVQIENVDALFAFSAEIVFDNSIAELVQDVVVIGGFWNSDVIELSIVEDDRLCITISLQQTANEDGIDGNGELFTFSIEGIAVGESDLTFENLIMIDENGNEVPNFDGIEITNGKIIVE